MKEMDHNAHSVYLMYYHLIMVVKYRRNVIDDPISKRAREIWEYIAPSYGITLEEWNHDVDHVHVMFRAQPKSELSKFINAYKSASSRLLKKEYPEIREKLWKEAFWSQSFCLLTAGGAPVEVVKYRRKVIDDPISKRAREIWEYIAPSYGITLEEWNHDVDHVHVMFRAQPKSELSKFINAYKSASSRLLKKEYPEIREKLWKEAFWSQSFCLLTAGGAPVEVIRQYIESQGEKR